MKKPLRYYLGTPPKECNICHAPIKGQFVDGAHYTGPWADMCPRCHAEEGRGFGTGLGQQYTQQRNGQWLKTKG